LVAVVVAVLVPCLLLDQWQVVAVVALLLLPSSQPQLLRSLAHVRSASSLVVAVLVVPPDWQQQESVTAMRGPLARSRM
jgi:hypothetical protein